MRGFFLIVFGLIAGLAIGAAASDADWGFAVRARPAASGGMVQSVNRTHKADRSDRAITRVGKEPMPSQNLMDGCETASSPLAASAQIPARCAA